MVGPRRAVYVERRCLFDFEDVECSTFFFGKGWLVFEVIHYSHADTESSFITRSGNRQTCSKVYDPIVALFHKGFDVRRSPTEEHIIIHYLVKRAHITTFIDESSARISGLFGKA